MIRPAIPQDAPAIAAIWNRIIRDTTVTFQPDEKSPAEVVASIAQDCLVWVEDDRLLGFARFYPFRGGSGYRFTVEHTILLHPDGQGRGGGRALLTALCAAAKDKDLHVMVAACSGENNVAIEFHAACGFVTVATMPEVGFKFGRWIDLVLMQKHL